MFDIIDTPLAGLKILKPRVRQDERGRFIKTFHAEYFAANGLRTDFKESYYSVSARGVLRGMHFQTPPADHAKLVYCSVGKIHDVVLDLRKNVPTYGSCFDLVLDAAQGTMLYLPSGLAHGFLALEDNTITAYSVTSVYDPASDAGILWSSFGFAWPTSAPILSERDGSFPSLEDFISPF